MSSRVDKVMALHDYTGITDEVLAILYLEECDWNLLEAVQTIMMYPELTLSYPKRGFKCLIQRQQKDLPVTVLPTDITVVDKTGVKVAKQENKDVGLPPKEDVTKIKGDENSSKGETTSKKKCAQEEELYTEKNKNDEGSQANDLPKDPPSAIVKVIININEKLAHELDLSCNLTVEEMKIIVKSEMKDKENYDLFCDMCYCLELSDSDELYNIFRPEDNVGVDGQELFLLFFEL
ncbi:hypothetical protein GWI33_013454 [Rhynchophorus ferrugineus]|uniref:Uncharacterized protein n=1 Tax=Rhynchophorus ferrugineus TaxID=354439 RepID=A0A834I971_RHYFE|nr:hypothetical protein GWI33_013454 [Rhynchophorus ferrugineus]